MLPIANENLGAILRFGRPRCAAREPSCLRKDRTVGRHACGGEIVGGRAGGHGHRRSRDAGQRRATLLDDLKEAGNAIAAIGAGRQHVDFELDTSPQAALVIAISEGKACGEIMSEDVGLRSGTPDARQRASLKVSVGGPRWRSLRPRGHRFRGSGGDTDRDTSKVAAANRQARSATI